MNRISIPEKKLKKPSTFKFTQQTIDRIGEIAKKKKATKTAVVEYAVAELYKEFKK